MSLFFFECNAGLPILSMAYGCNDEKLTAFASLLMNISKNEYLDTKTLFT